MRIFTCFFVLLFLFTGAIRADIFVDESFEGSFPPTGWAKFSDGFSWDGWQQTDAKSHDGTKSALAEVQYVYPTDIWLVTPAIDLSAAPSAKLYFYEDQDSWTDSGEHHYIAVSTTSQTQSSAFTTILDMTPGTHTINGFDGNMFEVDLSAYAGQKTVYVAFHHSDTGSPSDAWYIDDVLIKSPFNHDVMVYSLNMNTHYPPESVVQPSATIQNDGLNSETFEVDFGYFDHSGTRIVLSTKTVTNLASGARTDVVFDSYTFGRTEYDYFVRTRLSGDQDTSNDERIKHIDSFPNERQVVLAEEFTGTWCQYCPGAANALDSLAHTYPDNIAIVAFHNEDDFANSHAQARESFYGISGFPTTIFGGTRWSVGGANAGADWSGVYANYETLFLAERAEYIPYSMDLTFTENGSTISATATITFDGFPADYSDSLFFALCESHIAYNWQTSMDSLHFVERDFFPDDDGATFYTSSGEPYLGQQIQHSIEFTIPAGVVKENCELIAYMQNPVTKVVTATSKVGLGNSPSSIREKTEELIAGSYSLQQNYPNPFNPATTIRYRIARAEQVRLELYSSTGELVKTIVNEKQAAGEHAVKVQADELASGLYFYKISSGAFTETRKMLLIK